jgi:glycerol-3-phosphate dehydrogenase
MKRRVEALGDVAGKAFDVCIIGGGATGAGCALDAQLRGFKTVMLDAGDFAGSTSSKATKIVHGGVRYLEEAVKNLDPKEYHVLIRALHERILMLENAPYLTRKLEFLVPCFSWIDAAYLDIGLKIYDWLAGAGRRLSPSQFLSRAETLKRMPGVKNKGLVGSVAYADGQFDDARYNLALVQSFTEAGGTALNYARVEGFGRDERGRLNGATVKDQISGEQFSISAKVFVNATGPLSDTIRHQANPGKSARMRLSKGSHIFLPLELFPTRDAMLIPKTDDGRVLFAIPWGGRLLVGTTENEVEPGDELLVTRDEIAFMLEQLNKYLQTAVTPEQVVSGFAGARPLVAEEHAQDTKRLARDDVIEIDAASGLISIMGGKWTTHRAMAEDTVNAVQKSLGIQGAACSTRNHRLHGAVGFSERYPAELSHRYGLSDETARHLAGKFGTAADQVMELVGTDASLGEPIVAGLVPLRAEVVYSIRHEMAVTVEDVLARRIGLQLFSWRDATRAAPVVGAILGKELEWSEERVMAETKRYVGEIKRLLEVAGLALENVPKNSG